MLRLMLSAVERGVVPDRMTRWGIRYLCQNRIRLWRKRPELDRPSEEFVRALATSPIALTPERANDQHYELPPEFFGAVLGARRKYSCCYWEDPAATLDEAEDAALRLTCQRAQIENGQRILDLGCGWGSLSLWIAKNQPECEVVAVSNSRSQVEFVASVARASGLSNLRTHRADMNSFRPSDEDLGKGFDRVVSVEMFEHMRNYDALLGRIASWMRPDGRMFVHVFCHRDRAYPFLDDGPQNWMGKYFFTGGMMPSADLLDMFPRHMSVVERWSWNGDQYRKTAEAWLERLDARRQGIMPILEEVYGREDAARWFQRWRLFFLAVSEVFGFNDGKEWFVSHHLLRPSR